jgi:CRISPR-associated protein Cmr6
MTLLVRDEIKDHFSQSDSVNPSLLLQKGMLQCENSGAKKEEGKPSNKKTDHLKNIIKLPASEEYKNAFNRWLDLTCDANRFQQSAMALENRLLIGLTGNGMLETGCSLSRNYGMPYIPGSSVKGVVRAWATKTLSNSSAVLEALFGTYDSEQTNPVAASVIFHDAWWIPQGDKKPFVLDVVTTHHQAYYNGSQDLPKDIDSPIPKHMLAVQGSFLFVLEGDPNAIKLCQTILEKALAQSGIGAKTAADYGYMKINDDLLSKLLKQNLEVIKQKEESRLSVEEKILASLSGQLESQISNNIQNASGELREELKLAVEKAKSWRQEDIQQLQKIVFECIKYWDPKRKNKKLKGLGQKLDSMEN